MFLNLSYQLGDVLGSTTEDKKGSGDWESTMEWERSSVSKWSGNSHILKWKCQKNDKHGHIFVDYWHDSVSGSS